MSGEDLQHTEGGGTIPKEVKDLVYNHVVVEELYTLQDLNRELALLKKKHPICRSIPTFHPKLLKRKTKSMRMKAADAHTLMRYR